MVAAADRWALWEISLEVLAAVAHRVIKQAKAVAPVAVEATLAAVVEIT